MQAGCHSDVRGGKPQLRKHLTRVNTLLCVLTRLLRYAQHVRLSRARALIDRLLIDRS